MKKIILSVAAVFAFGFANAQEEVKETKNGGFAKGDVFISGAFSIDSDKTGDAKETMFEIAPKAGFFVTENIAIGAKVGYKSEKAENAAGVETMDESTLSLGAFGRYYITPANQFSVFGQLGFDYSSVEDNLAVADSKTNEIGLGLGLGLSYFVSNNFAIEATWGGLNYTTNDNGGADGVDSTDSINLSVDMRSIGFGLLYKF